MKTIEMLNKRKTCRTCLKLHSSSNELISIFETEKFIVPPNSTSVQFSEMLSTISNHLCSVDDSLPKSICFACMNSVRLAYCFKLQSETSYNTLIEQFGSGCAKIKIEYSDYVPEQQIDREEIDQIGIDTEIIPELTTSSIELPPKIIDDIEIKIEPEEEEELLVKITDILPISQEETDYNESFKIYDENDDSNTEFVEYQADSEMESISDGKNSEKYIYDDKQSASGTSATDSGTCTNAEEPDLLTEQELVKLKCRICLKQLFSLGSLKRHKKIHADMHCNFCRRKFTGRAAIKYHTKCIHPDKYPQFQLNGQMKAIVKIPLLNIPKCCSCNRMFCSIEALYKHHADCDHKCIECDIVILRKDLYFKHLEKEHGIHVITDHLECPFCFNKFVSERGLKDHITRIHPEKNDLNGIKNLLSPGTSPSTSNKIELTKDEFIAKYMKIYQGDLWNCSLCEMKLKKRNIFRHLINRHVVTKPCKCPFCPIRFQSSEMRIRHLSNDHPDGYKCETCNTLFEHGDTYLEHMLYVHGVVVDLPTNEEEPDIKNEQLKFSCNEMEKMYTKEQFVEHYTRTVSTDTTLCLPCKKNICKTGINFHLCRYHATEMAYKCAFCIKRFTRFEYRSKHMKTAHPTDYYCYECNVQYSHHKLYSEHMKAVHSFILTTEPEPGEEDDIPFNDLIFVPILTTANKNYHESDFRVCNKVKKNLMKLKIKQDLAHTDPASSLNNAMKKDEFVKLYITRDGKNVTCKVCSTTFSCVLLSSHLKRWHATTMPYSCQMCDKDFYRTDARITHMSKLHPNELKCHFCNVQFISTPLYVKHMQDNHNFHVPLPATVKPVSANISDLYFVVQPERTLGKPQHKLLIKIRSKSTKPTNESPVTKDEFIKLYIKNSKLKENVFCIPCDKKLCRKNIIMHLRTKHSTKSSFKCGLCESEFLSTKQRSAHMKNVHTDDYRCQQCSIQFITSTSYARHMKANHKKKVPESIINYKVLDIPISKLMFVQHLSPYKKNQKRKAHDDDEKMDIEVDAPEEFPEDEVAPEEVANEDFAPVKVSTKEVAPEVVKAQKSLNNTQHCLECNEHFESSRSYRFHMRIHNIKTEDFPVQIKIEPEAKLCIIDMKQEPKKFHTCDICQKSFVAVISLNAHKKFRHQIKPIVDKDDDDIKIVDKPLIRPLKTKRDKKNIQHECEVCDVVLFRRDYLLNHIKIVHPGEYMCTFCSRVSHNYVDLIHHIKTFHKERTFDDTNLHGCQKCYAKFSVKDHLNIHMMEKHVKKPTVSNLYCAPCKKTYPFTFILSRHRKHATHVELSKIEERLIHNFEERLKLNSKEKKYDTIIVKNIPQRRNSINNQGKYYLKYFVNKGSLFICDICKATFTIRKQLIQHLKTHTEIPTHDCPSCPLKFLIKHKYDLHLKTHTVDRKEKSKYSCKICLSLFSTRKNLMIHINVRHSPTDNPNFICGVCGNGHANENELITHFKTHTGDNLPQVFVKEETEENPIDIDKPFCEICQLPFKYKIIQNIHNNMWHNESNPDRHLTIEVQRLKKEEKNVIKFIKCKICEEVFIKPDDLDEHVKTLHSDHDKSDDDSKLIIDESSSDQSKTDFFCDKCNLKFPCQQYLTNHQTLFCKSSPKVIINVSENQNTLNEQ